MQQYLDLAHRILDEGVWVANQRTGVRCLTVIGARFEYDCRDGRLALLTTKKTAWKAAIAEMLGYIRGYDNADQFAAAGTKTWYANANETAAWLASPHRQGVNDLGRVYGVQGRRWRGPDGTVIDQLRKVVDHLSKGIDDRGEIVTFWNPGELDLGCLRPCMHTHTFSVLGGELYLTSTQRSVDYALGFPFNGIQVSWLLMVMAQITGLKPAKAFHDMVNVHLYEDQVSILRDTQLPRTPRALPKLVINPAIRTLEDLETWVTVDDFSVEGYDPHPAVKYPFTT